MFSYKCFAGERETYNEEGGVHMEKGKEEKGGRKTKEEEESKLKIDLSQRGFSLLFDSLAFSHFHNEMKSPERKKYEQRGKSDLSQWNKNMNSCLQILHCQVGPCACVVALSAYKICSENKQTTNKQKAIWQAIYAIFIYYSTLHVVLLRKYRRINNTYIEYLRLVLV